MCLASTRFALQYNEVEKDFVGIVFKKMKNETIGIGFDNYGKKLKSIVGQWKQASFNWNFNQNPKHDDGRAFYTETDDSGKEYHPGFHIFLTEKAAEKYDKGYYSKVVKVMYKRVLAFGFNETGDTQAMCVIADQMKILEILS